MLGFIALYVYNNEEKRAIKQNEAENNRLLDQHQFQKNLEYNLLLSNLRYKEYHNLLSLINDVTDRLNNFDQFVTAYQKFIDRREATNGLFELDSDAFKEVLVPLDDLHRKLKAPYTLAHAHNTLFTENKELIIKLMTQLKILLRDSTLKPLKNS